MKNWAEMSAADWYTAGVQLDMFAGLEGDGCGTIALDLDAKPEPVIEIPERADGALFGLALSDEPASDGALFSVVAA